jgi:hypothetical protein
MIAEDNSVPIYDLNFSFVQSIKFPSYNDILNWLKTNNLDNKTYRKFTIKHNNYI